MVSQTHVNQLTVLKFLFSRLIGFVYLKGVKNVPVTLFDTLCFSYLLSNTFSYLSIAQNFSSLLNVAFSSYSSLYMWVALSPLHIYPPHCLLSLHSELKQELVLIESRDGKDRSSSITPVPTSRVPSNVEPLISPRLPTTSSAVAPVTHLPTDWSFDLEAFVSPEEGRPKFVDLGDLKGLSKDFLAGWKAPSAYEETLSWVKTGKLVSDAESSDIQNTSDTAALVGVSSNSGGRRGPGGGGGGEVSSSQATSRSCPYDCFESLPDFFVCMLYLATVTYYCFYFFLTFWKQSGLSFRCFVLFLLFFSGVSFKFHFFFAQFAVSPSVLLNSPCALSLSWEPSSSAPRRSSSVISKPLVDLKAEVDAERVLFRFSAKAFFLVALPLLLIIVFIL